ncbi:MAG: endonuclease/exonuclease/phosphatase family protein, partial [Myxococcota bacterium]
MTSLPQLAPATTPLHGLQPAEQHFSVLSYNVLLPNSGGGGWWVSKYYDDTTAPQHRTWAHRQALLRQTLLDAMADIVCLQEVVAETWDDDFGFMLEAGYASALHRKFRLRPATFWRSERWDEVVVRHKDKTLVTLLRERSTERLLAVINVHLTAAPQPKRRFQQLFEALDQVRKECFKLKHDPTTVAVVVCGDFNCNPEDTATDHLLCQGPIDPDFREPRWPEQQISSKVRGQPFGPFMDLVRTANGGTPMPTLIAVRLAEVFSTEGLASAIRAMFAQFAGEAEVMDREAVEAWVNRINGELRGSEYT